MNTLNSDKLIPYTGNELAPHWIYRTFQLVGNSLVAFQGPADVPLDHMVDLEDIKKNGPIGSPKMLHFLGEWFIDSLDQGILYQHLFVHLIQESLFQRKIENLSRKGNDLYYQGRKLSVSIATKSPVSVLMHFGINIETHGTPVPTAGLGELRINPESFADELLSKWQTDSAVWKNARAKVLPR